MHRKFLWLIICLLLLGAGRLAAQTGAEECPPLPLGLTGGPFSYYVGVADNYASRQRSGEAIAAYTCAINAAPDYAPAYARRGLAHTALGNDEAAVADFNQAIELDETLLETYINRGIFYTRAGNYALAIGDFTLAATLNPASTRALQNRAMVHAIEKNFDLALADLEQAIALAPDDPAPYAARAAIYSAFALQDYQRFLEASGSPRANLPAGTPGEVLFLVDESLRSGSVTVWLALQRAGQ